MSAIPDSEEPGAATVAKAGSRAGGAAGTLGRRFALLPANLRGVAWVLAGSLGFSIMAVLIKLLGRTLDPFQIVLFRTAVGLIVLLPLVARAGVASLRTTAPLLHVGRAMAGLTAMFCGFYAFTHLPLATATAVSFAKPLFMILVAFLALGEVVRWRRWTATVVGFGGVLIMLRPGAGPFDPAMLVALMQAAAIAVAVAFVKKFPAEERHLTILFWFAVVSTTVALAPAIAVWRWPDAQGWALGVGVGVVGVASQACIVRGYRIGEATALSPFDYSRLIFATLAGLVIFAEVPDLWTFAGAAVIVGSTLYIARREARLARAPAPPPRLPPPAEVG
ncbi:MAG: DMT family transporter [Azospirillaceae bacterium]